MSWEAGRRNLLRFVLFQEEGVWVAMCVEKHIGAYGRSADDARHQLRIIYRAELDRSLEASGTAFGDIGPAPETYMRLYQESPNEMRGSIYDRHGGKAIDAAQDARADKLAA